MGTSRTGGLRPRLLLSGLAAAIVCLHVAALPAAAAPRSQAATCAGTSSHPHQAAYRAVRGATLCLINAERRRRGLAPLRHNRRLAIAASRHARDMTRRRYFAHRSLDGRDFVTRIIRTGYVRSRRGRWLLGENLAWGGGRAATPRAIVRAWMRSPGHRRNILNRRYVEIGVALVRRAPVGRHRQAATYVTEFGAR